MGTLCINLRNLYLKKEDYSKALICPSFWSNKVIVIKEVFITSNTLWIEKFRQMTE